MRYFIKTNENGRIEMLLKERHPLINGFIEVELTDEQYNKVVKEIGRYTVKKENDKTVLEYLPKTIREKEAEEAEEQKALMKGLRKKRERECFSVVNRGFVWYMRLSDENIGELNDWYQAWLEVTDTLVVPEKPKWIK